MRVRWFGQSAFLLDGPPRVFIDPFGPMPGPAERGRRFDYPPIAGVPADLLLVTHEHPDHNAVHASEADVDRRLGTPDDPVVLLLRAPGA